MILEPSWGRLGAILGLSGNAGLASRNNNTDDFKNAKINTNKCGKVGRLDPNPVLPPNPVLLPNSLNDLWKTHFYYLNPGTRILAFVFPNCVHLRERSVIES